MHANLDVLIFTAINNLTRYSPALNVAGVFFAEYSQYVLGAILAVLLFYPKSGKGKNRIMVIVALLAALTARWGVKPLILYFYGRPRAYLLIPDIHKLIQTFKYEDYQSFPSGHAIFFFALAMVLYLFNRKLGLWYFAAALVMGLARIFVGVHWPSDILGGAILGMLTGGLVYKLYVRYKSGFEKFVNGAFSKLGF